MSRVLCPESCVFQLARVLVVCDSAALYEGDDFHGVGAFEFGLCAKCARHDFPVELDGYAVGAQSALFHQFGHGDWGDDVFFLAVDDHGYPFVTVATVRLEYEKRVAEEAVPCEVVRPSVTLFTRYSVIANGR